MRFNVHPPFPFRRRQPTIINPSEPMLPLENDAENHQHHRHHDRHHHRHNHHHRRPVLQSSEQPIDEESWFMQMMAHEESGDSILQDHVPPSKVPPASHHAICKLAQKRVYPCDKLALENDSTECAVCSDPLINGIMLCQMPCGHVYHINCIVSWLIRSCTCPECRYEIETEDSAYEIGRQKRMQAREKQQKNSCCGSSSDSANPIQKYFFPNPAHPYQPVEHPEEIPSPFFITPEMNPDTTPVSRAA